MTKTPSTYDVVLPGQLPMFAGVEPCARSSADAAEEPSDAVVASRVGNHLDEATTVLVDRLRRRTGMKSRGAVVQWCVRAMAEHYDRIDRLNAEDRPRTARNREKAAAEG